jgi:glycosyltransferase involved in cell wall biosynthesis
VNIFFYDRLKVGQLITISTHKYELISNLSKLGYNVVLLNSDYPKKVGEIICSNPPSLGKGISSKLLSSGIVRRFRGEIGILWSLGRDVSFFLSAFILIISKKRNIDVIYRRHSLFNSDYFLAKLFRLPLVKEVNGIESDNARITGFTDRFSLQIIERIERFNMPRADKIIVVTPKLKETLQKDYGVPRDKIVVIPNGANTELFKPMDTKQARRQVKLAQAGHLVVFVGDLVVWDGVDYLIRSIPYVVEEVPEARFLIVGDGMMRQELVKLAGQVGVSDKIIFTGMVPYRDVPLYINASDICAAPFAANRDEKVGLSPLKMYEYMACGKPVVASRISGLEMLEDSGAGILVEPESPLALAQTILRLLQNKELNQQMGRSGRKYVVENRSWASVARKVAEVSEQTCGTKMTRGEMAN